MSSSVVSRACSVGRAARSSVLLRTGVGRRARAAVAVAAVLLFGSGLVLEGLGPHVRVRLSVRVAHSHTRSFERTPRERLPSTPSGRILRHPNHRWRASRKGFRRFSTRCHGDDMVALAVILLIVGLILLFLGIFIKVASFLLWIGIIVLIIAIIIGLFRFLRRNV